MLVVLLTSLGATGVAAQPVFEVARDGSLVPEAVSGRLVVYLVREGSSIDAEPANGPFFSDPQPMLGVSVDRWLAGEVVAVGPGADRFPADDLQPGVYRAQAVLDRSRLRSSWREEPGNLYSSVVRFTFADNDSDRVVRLDLERVTTLRSPPRAERVRFHTFESRLLTDARRLGSVINVGVIEPIGFDPDRRYPVVYEVPGFGGTHLSAARRAQRLAQADPGSGLGVLARNAFWVVLDPEGPNGHHLFYDSPCNGPVGSALVHEIVPPIDLLYPTITEPGARLLRGHSSGGWSVVHLAMAYPDAFGGAWSSAPDPLGFTAFQAVDIYSDASMYTGADGDPVPSYTTPDGMVRMTIADENAMESVMGPANTSGQQWDSWQAVFGPCDESGRPARLFDEATGAIDRGVAELYRRADPAERVRRDPAEAGRLARQRVRIIVGDADEFDLDRAVGRFAGALEPLRFGGEHGWIETVAGETHGSILDSPAAERLRMDMVDHLGRSGHLPGQ
ncbi:MAG: alpha/beta hydrolase-fold protein [Planctomycetota bacterium]